MAYLHLERSFEEIDQAVIEHLGSAEYSLARVVELITPTGKFPLDYLIEQIRRIPQYVDSPKFDGNGDQRIRLAFGIAMSGKILVDFGSKQLLKNHINLQGVGDTDVDVEMDPGSYAKVLSGGLCQGDDFQGTALFKYLGFPVQSPTIRNEIPDKATTGRGRVMFLVPHVQEIHDADAPPGEKMVLVCYEGGPGRRPMDRDRPSTTKPWINRRLHLGWYPKNEFYNTGKFAVVTKQ